LEPVTKLEPVIKKGQGLLRPKSAGKRPAAV
jgi:hypothetical protein